MIPLYDFVSVNLQGAVSIATESLCSEDEIV